MSEQYWGCSDKMSEENFSPAETLPLGDYAKANPEGGGGDGGGGVRTPPLEIASYMGFYRE